MPETSKRPSIRQSSILNRHSICPAALITLAFAAGIALSLICRACSFSGFVVGNALLLCASSLAWRRNRLALSLTLGLAAIGVSGLMFAIAHRDGRDKTDLRFLISRRFIPLDEPISFEGCVVEDSFRRGEEDILTLQFHTIFQMDQSRECKGKGILRIPVAGSEDFIGLSAPYMRGDCIKGWAIWHIPRNYRNPGSADNVGQLANRGIYLIGRAKSPRLLEKIPGGCATLWSRVAVNP
jgi:hypothetical protein